MAESRRNHLRKRRAQRTLAVDRARLDPEVGAVSARQVADFLNDRTLLSGNDQQHRHSTRCRWLVKAARFARRGMSKS